MLHAWGNHKFTAAIIIESVATFLDYGSGAGDTTVAADTNLIGPLELRVPLHLYNMNLSSLYVWIIMLQVAMFGHAIHHASVERQNFGTFCHYVICHT